MFSEEVSRDFFRSAWAIRRLAKALVVELDPRLKDCENLERLADAAENLLTDAIIRDRL